MTALQTQICQFDLAEHGFKELSLDELNIDFADKTKVYWVHCDLNHPQELLKIARKLQLPDHVIDWCRNLDKTPKLIDDDMSLTLQEECLTSGEIENNQDIDFESLIIHLTPTFCFTAASEAMPPLSLFIKSYPKALRYAKTSCFILFLIMDNTVNDYAKILIDFQSKSDQIDLKVREMSDNIYAEVITIKKQLMKTKRYISAIRDTLMRISGRKIPVISKECRLSLRNLFSHSQMIYMQLDSVRDILNSTLDQIDNGLMQKMNATMKVLTSFAAIFLPLSLIAGIYGMNFAMPEFHWKYGYVWSLGLMLICAAILIYVFKKKKWF